MDERRRGAIVAGPDHASEPAAGPYADSPDAAGISRHLLRPIVFQEPDRVVDPPSWLEHVPFAFWIVEALRPVVLVELGTHTGNSYAAFAQAVQTLHLPTACYAVDTWEGDPHAGFYGEDVYADWRGYHDRHFSAFSRLIRARFADALVHFADGSIDLLHIDGYHTLDAIQSDFEMWLPKVSARGVVLLHDINVREGDFGAWRLWERVQETYPSFTFLHGHGLGVLGVGRDFPEPVRWLLTRGAAPADVSQIRDHFAAAGRRVSRFHDATRSQARTVAELRGRLEEHARRHEESAELEAQLRAECATRDAEIQDLQARLDQESASRGDVERELDAVSVERDLLDARAAAQADSVRELDADVRLLLARREDARGRTWRFQLPRAVPRAPHEGSAPRRAGRILRAAPAVTRLVLTSRHPRRAAKTLLKLARRPGRMRDAQLIARSGLFDPSFYLQHNPDVAHSGLDPVVHYILHGGAEGRQPSALFDAARYLELYPDVSRSGLDPLTHFLLHGAAEERSPGPDFDTRYYLASNPDVRAAGVNPLGHFVQIGWREGRNPSASFDCAAYLERYEDVRTSGLNPLVHFVESGRAEGRDATPVAEPRSTLAVPSRVQLRSRRLSEPAPDPPTVVCLTHVCPWPPHAGNAYRVHRMLRHLQSEGFRIVPVIAPLPGESPDAAAVRRVADEFGNIVVVERNGPILHRLRDVPDVLSSLDAEFTPRYSAILGEEDAAGARERELLVLERTYCHDAAIAAMLRLDSALGPYVLLAEYVWMSRLLPLVGPRAVKAIDTHDVYSTKAEKVLKFGLPELWMEAEEEARRLNKADLVVAIQHEERDILQRLAPDRRVVTAGVDFEVVGDTRLPDAPRVLCVGSGNVLNVRGLRDFLRFAWPSVRHRVPDAELWVVGALSESLRDAPPGVRALGRVENLDELYADTRVVINPAVAGTGLKIKTIEALSRLRPVVTWPAGVDGLPRELCALCDVAQDWYVFGTLVAGRLASDRRESFSEDQRRTIERTTSSQGVYAELASAFRELLSARVVAADRTPSGT